MTQRFGTGSGPAGESDETQAVRELLDRYHSRASIRDGSGSMSIDPGQVLENISLAMERLDLDINTELSIEDDVASFSELAGMIQGLLLGPLLAAHVVNTAMRIMSARYPAELVAEPLPARYDLRALLPLSLDDRNHDLAKAIFNRRATAAADLDADDLSGPLEEVGVNGQLEVFTALFWMYGTKISALKQRTGIA